MLRAGVLAACAAVGVVAAGGPAGGQFSLDLEKSRQARAELTTKGLLQACEAYYLNPRSLNTYPKALKDLLMPPFGGAPYLPDAKHLTDPWGKDYQYKVVGLDKGQPRAFVWTDRVDDGKTIVLGTKPPEPGARKK
jgi:hypothetical protein